MKKEFNTIIPSNGCVEEKKRGKSKYSYKNGLTRAIGHASHNSNQGQPSNTRKGKGKDCHWILKSAVGKKKPQVSSPCEKAPTPNSF